jgi:hypothetical protein
VTRDSDTDVVLGLVHGYTADVIQPFLVSLKRVAPDAKIILACSKITADTRATLQRLGCQILDYRYRQWHIAGRTIWLGNSRWRRMHRGYARWIDALPGLTTETKLQWKARLVRQFLDPNTRRFVEFYLRLRQELPKFRRVLLSDLRDVVFQSNPFDLIQDEGIMFGLEDDRLTIGSQWANSVWLERVGGPAIRDELAAKRISCVGVVLGSGTVIATYLHRLVEALTRPGIDIARFHGADTGAHNMVVYRGALTNVRFADFSSGGILNMHGLRTECIRWTPDGLLCDANQKPFAVIHQYDRHPEVHARLVQRLAL